MHTHAYAHHRAFGPGMTSKGVLRGHGCGYRVCSTCEGHEESISLRIYLLATICLERGTQQVSTFGQYVGVALAELLEQRGGSLDVREEERDGPRRELMHT